MSGVDELADSVDNAIGCLAPLISILIVLAGLKIFFWLVFEVL